MADVCLVIVLPSQHCHLHSCPLSSQCKEPVRACGPNLNETQSANVVSADYDKVVAFFEDLNLYLNRLKILEGEIPPVAELRLAVAQVLTSVLILCGICAKYVKTRRLGKWRFPDSTSPSVRRKSSEIFSPIRSLLSQVSTLFN